MIKRSELKKDMYVRFTDTLDGESFCSRLLKGRYFRVTMPAKEDDDCLAWSNTFGVAMFYRRGYMKSASNTNLCGISCSEEDKIKSIVDGYDNYREFYKLGRKINNKIDNIESLIEEDLCIDNFSLWDIIDADHLIESVYDEMDDDYDDVECEIDDLREMWQELELLLDELTELEGRVIRGENGGM